MMPEDAVRAYSELNGTLFQGRMFHILPGKANDKKEAEEGDEKNYKDKKRKELKKTAASAHNWNTLFMGANVVAELIARAYGKSKEEVLESATGGSGAAVRLALGETQIVLDMKKFLETNNVRLESFDEDTAKRSKTVILAKNLPSNTTVEELREKFAQFGVLDKIVLPPSGVTCLIQFADPSEARKAFKKLAYSKFKHLPLYLEWAPENVFKSKGEAKQEEEPKPQETAKHEEKAAESEDDTPPQENTTLFIKNLGDEATEEKIKDVFKKIGTIHTVQIAKKKSTEDAQLWTPLGYGFIQFKLTASADKALKTMQMVSIDGKSIELKRSDRTLNMPVHAERKSVKKKDQKESTKIMVRNIPFQATANEVRLLFQTFGELKAVRLPKKTGVDQHRGFGFIDFVNKSDAKGAYQALHLSTHLYGRRLVLEWAATEEDVSEIRKRTAETTTTGGSAAKRSKKALMKEEDFIPLGSSNNNNADDEDE
jgi:multiple RNA-binding domain-containing protein 1